MPTARDLLPPAMWYKNGPESRWLDSNPRPTATPIDLDALAALLLHIGPQPPGKRRVYGRLTILSFSYASAMRIDVGSASHQGRPRCRSGEAWDLTGALVYVEYASH